MSKSKAVLLLFTCFLLSFSALAQLPNGIRKGTVVLDSMTVSIDSFSIIPNTFVLDGLDSVDYEVDFLNAKIRLLNEKALGQRVEYAYRSFGMNLLHPQQHRSQTLNYRQRGSIYQSMTPIVPKTEELFANNASSLQSTGSISRGVVIGTNQDFILNSTMNLQLSGQLAEKLTIVANITDKNVPIQPDGNTQSIQDFDQVYIKLNYDNRFMLSAGDIETQFDQDAFLKVNRKYMGLEFNAHNTLKNGDGLKNTVGGGVSKGKYVKKDITPINGVQGPYRLTGEQNEINIVIIAGSERVYIDGQLLTRGQDQDYTIDYNTGELSFTVKHLMTAEKRVIVEYEYSDKHYARYNLYTFNEFTHEKNGKLKLNVNLFHEQDLKNHSIQPELNNLQKLFLSQLPPDVENGLYPHADSAYYNTNEILYELRDTVVNGENYQVYVYSTSVSKQLYRLGFSLVGVNQGNYVLVSSAANGRVFRWVAPVNGVPQGNYEPVQLLTTPKTQDLATIGATYDFNANTGLSAELALSNYDENNFSKNNKNNVGFAYMMRFHHQKELKNKQPLLNPWLFYTKVFYEFIHKNFRVFESTREVEFKRNYNLDEDYSKRFSEQMAQLTLGFQNAEIGETRYDFNCLSRFGSMNALKNELTSNIHKQGWKFSTATSYLFSNDSIQKTNFVKTYNNLSKSFRQVEVGVRENFEYNAMRDRFADSLRMGSNGFNEATFFLKNSDSLPYLFQISYKNRVESMLKNNVLGLGTMSNDAQFSFELAKLKNNRLKADLTYRNTQIRNQEGRFNGENYFLAGIDYTGRFFKNAIVLNTHYEAGSGMEQKMVYSYLKVAEGQGVYTWNDYNGNGIEELDEFEVAAFQDQANYIKVWQTGNEYINTYNNQFLQTIQLRPANVWANKKGIKGVLARFSNTTTFKTVQKNTFTHNANAINPFYFKYEDSNLVSSNLAFINTLTYNHKSVFGIDFIVQANKTKSLLYYGTDMGGYNVQQLVVRGNPCDFLSLKTDYAHSEKSNFSQFMSSRSYRIEMHHTKTEVDFHYKNKLFVQLSYLFFHKRNRLGFQKALQHKVDLEVKYKMLKKGNLIADVAYINMDYNDVENTSLSYEMLDGLSVGHNMTWNVKYEANITDFLQLNLLYQGRYTQGNRVVHTGNLEVRAHF